MVELISNGVLFLYHGTDIVPGILVQPFDQQEVLIKSAPIRKRWRTVF